MRAVLLMSLSLFVAAVVGCASPGLSRQQLARARRVPRYPARAGYGANLDVFVVRDGHTIRLVNATPLAYHHMVLWLNQQYAFPVSRVSIGTDNTLNLTNFYNRFGEHYPVGTLLRPENSARLVLAELYNPRSKRRHRLVVQPRR